MSSPLYRLGTLAVICVVALRLSIGWHFFQEGASKLKNDDFRSVNFLQQSKGPLASHYKELVSDRFGIQRLDLSRTQETWRRFVENASEELGLSDEVRQRAQKIYERYVELLKNYFRDNGDEIHKYRLELERWQTANQDPTKHQIPFERDWLAKKEYELLGTAAPWLSEVRILEDAYQDEVLGLSDQSAAARNVSRLEDLSQKTWVDHSVTALTLGVGICLLLGFFTRLAALAGVAFLLSVAASQPFWIVGADLSYASYQMVEIAALLFLAAAAAGRYAGLDFFTYFLFKRRSSSIR